MDRARQAQARAPSGGPLVSDAAQRLMNWVCLVGGLLLFAALAGIALDWWEHREARDVGQEVEDSDDEKTKH